VKTQRKEGARGKGLASIVVGLAISGIFLYLALGKVDLNEVWQQAASVSLGILSLSLITKLFCFLFLSLRSVVAFGSHRPLAPRAAFQSVLLGFVGNNVLPLRMGEILRAAYLSRRTHASLGTSLAVVVLERVLDLFSLVLVFLVAATFSIVELPADSRFYLLGAAVTTVLLLAVAASRAPNVATAVVRRLTSVLGSRLSGVFTARFNALFRDLATLSSTKGVGMLVLLTLAYWLATMASAQVWIWAFGLTLPWFAAVVITLFLAFGTFLPSSPGFVGTYHYFCAASLLFLGVDEETATAFAIVGHFISVVPFTLLGLPVVAVDLLRSKRDAVRLSEAPPPAD